MIILLRILFFAVIGTMLAITGWAGSQCALFSIPDQVLHHPWFLATLLDAYWAFITFYVWVAWKEQSLGARVLWFVSIILWGNIAMAVYMLIELFRIKQTAELRQLFSERRPGKILLPALFALAGIATYLLGAKEHF